MANFKGVIDYLHDAVPTMNTRHMWKGDESFKTTHGMTKDIDMSLMEQSLISPTEINILKAVNGKDMFTLKNMHEGFKLRVDVRATGANHSKPLESGKKTKLHFMSNHIWYLEPLESHYSESERGLYTVSSDDVLQSKILAAMDQIANAEELRLPLDHTAQKMSMTRDLRHLFTKMVLYLNDYNLAVTSKCTTKEVSGAYQSVVYPECDGPSRMEMMRNKRIVIDAEKFNTNEKHFINLAAAEYPSVWFAGDNIYNAVRMEADELAIVSSREIDMNGEMVWESPTALYHMICSIACKFGAVGDLATVLRDMRGRCKMMADMLPHTGSNVVVSNMPLSYSMDLALGIKSPPLVAQTKTGNYFATSQSLIHDLLVGMCFEASATTVVEDLGALGKMIGSSNPSANPMLNGLMRDHGLKYMDESKNVLLKNWRAVTGMPIQWGFGKMLKEYITGLCDRMYNDPISGDVRLPQLFLVLPYSHSPDSAWGLLRNWNGRGHMMLEEKRDRIRKEQKTASLTWAMGIRKQRPRVFANYEGSHSLDLSCDEIEFVSLCEGEYNITTMSINVLDCSGGRVDSTEESCTAFYKSKYLHTKCSLVYDIENNWHLPPTVRGTVFDDRASMKRSMIGSVKEAHERTAERNAKVVPSQIVADTARINAKVIESPPERMPTVQRLQMLAATARLEVDHKPSHAREDEDGIPRVAEYIVDGAPSDIFPNNNQGRVKKGERVHLGIIDTPGDGRCGLHGVVKDLTIRGLVDPSAAERTFKKLDQATGSTTWHAADEIAAAVDRLGFGLEVYADDINGGYGVQRYGKGEHYVTLHHNNGHYSAAVVMPDEGGKPVGQVIDVPPGRIDEKVIDSLFSVKKKF